MTTLQKLLPSPIQLATDRHRTESCQTSGDGGGRGGGVVATVCAAPPYGRRHGWTPRAQSDYGDGGAYPECHVAQYPLGMGETRSSSSSAAVVAGGGAGGSGAPSGGGGGKTLAVTLDAQGRVKYDAIARQGHSKDKVVYSKFTDLLPDEVLDEDVAQRPDEEAVEAVTEKTRQALEKLTSQKISAAMPVKAAEKKAPAQYIRYTPSQQGGAFNSGAKQRVIRMVEVQKDPMEPPKFKINAKIPNGPPSPPAPVMHSPTRKTSVKEQQDWKIPPCISNWKNQKGYTIPLDKRMAADGRGLQQLHINENFAKLSEALYIADRKSREAVEMRAQLEKKLAQKEKERKEELLRDLAKKAREERAGIRTALAAEDESGAVGGGGGGGGGGAGGGVRERDALRHERHNERARERNLARSGQDRRSRLDRERQRDISEQIALGVPRASGGAAGGATNSGEFDQRLFNQSRGLGSGFGDDDAYAVYDKPWRGGDNVAQHIYQPGKHVQRDVYGDDLDNLMSTSRFAPDKGFEGADRGGAPRSGPVQFERPSAAAAAAAGGGGGGASSGGAAGGGQGGADKFDMFNIDQFLTNAKESSKRPADDGQRHEKRRRR